MSENKIEYIIVCLSGVASYEYDYESNTLYGAISPTVEKWETCTPKEYEMICRYAADRSTYQKKYQVIRRVDKTEEPKENFSLEFIKEYYRKIDEKRLQDEIAKEAKRQAAAEKRHQAKVNKLMKELGISAEDVEKLIGKK